MKLRRDVARITAAGAATLVIGDDAILDAKRIATEVGPDIHLLMDRTVSVAHRYGMKDRDRAVTGYVVIDRAGKILVRRVDLLFGEHSDEIVRLVEAAGRTGN